MNIKKISAFSATLISLASIIYLKLNHLIPRIVSICLIIALFGLLMLYMLPLAHIVNQWLYKPIARFTAPLLDAEPTKGLLSVVQIVVLNQFALLLTNVPAVNQGVAVLFITGVLLLGAYWSSALLIFIQTVCRRLKRDLLKLKDYLTHAKD